MSQADTESPILNDLSAKMRCGIFTNSQGEILIIHDKIIEGSIDYVEFDSQEQSFFLIYDDGRMQALGIEFNAQIQSNLQHGTEVTLAFIQNKAIQSSEKVVFLIRDL